MNTLKIETVVYHKVNYFTLETFINKTYPGLDYDLVSDVEGSNDSCFECEVTGNPDEKYEANLRKGILGSHSTTVLLNMLAKDHLIPTGDYLIEICW